MSYSMYRRLDFETNPYPELGLSYDSIADKTLIDLQHICCTNRVRVFEAKLLKLTEGLAKASAGARDSQNYAAFLSVRSAAREYGDAHAQYVAVSNELWKVDEMNVAIKSEAYSKAIRLRREEVSKKAAEKAMEEQNERDYQASRRRG